MYPKLMKPAFFRIKSYNPFVLDIASLNLVPDFVHELRCEFTLLIDTHLGSKCLVRPPLGRGARCGFLHHLVDLLQSKTLGFGDEEVGVNEADRAKRSPDEENLCTEVALIRVDHVRSDHSNDLDVLLAK